MSATVVFAVVDLTLAVGLAAYLGHNTWRIRRDRRDAAEHRRFVDFYARMRAAGAAQARDPRTAEISQRFTMKVAGQADPVYIGRHRRGAATTLAPVVLATGRHRRAGAPTLR